MLFKNKAAAIFDLDGTLIPISSAERTFFFHLIKHGGLNFFDIVRMMGAVWSAGGNFHRMILHNKRYLRRKTPQQFEEIAQKYFEPRVHDMIFPNMKTTIERHRGRNELLLLLSGTLDVIADCFIRELGFDGGRAAILEKKNGRYTGRLQGILPYGVGKLEVLRDFGNKYGVDQNRTTLYANIYSDRYVMNSVENPVAVNPDKKLERYAEKRGWRVVDPKVDTP